MAIAAVTQWKKCSVTTVLPITRAMTVKVIYRFQVKGKRTSRISIIFQKHCGSKTDVKLCQQAFKSVQRLIVQLLLRVDVDNTVKGRNPLGVLLARLLLARLLLEYAAL
jgi:hypothetical protein